MTSTVLDFERMDEETQVALTEIHKRAEQAPQLAWSQADVEDIDDYQADHTTRWLGFYVAILVAMIAGLGAVWLHESKPATARIQVAAPVITTPLDVVVPAPPTSAPAPKATPETPDAQFLALMGQSGWNMTEAVPSTLINAAHKICQATQEGDTRTDILAALKRGTPEITPAHAQALINNAKTIYCP